jgi:hypothetical protein
VVFLTLIMRLRTDPEALTDLVILITRASNAIPDLVNVERLALGVATAAIELDHRHREWFPAKVAEDPEATALAIGLLDEVARDGGGSIH